MNDTRAKLETLFRRLTDPSISDLDALADFVWFRKLALSAEDVGAALGKPDATTAASSAPASPPPNDGPMWPFKKKHAGESIAHIARTDPEYLRFMLKQDYIRDPLKEMIRAALGIPISQGAKPPAAPAKPSDDFENP